MGYEASVLDFSKCFFSDFRSEILSFKCALYINSLYRRWKIFKVLDKLIGWKLFVYFYGLWVWEISFWLLRFLHCSGWDSLWAAGGRFWPVMTTWWMLTSHRSQVVLLTAQSREGRLLKRRERLFLIDKDRITFSLEKNYVFSFLLRTGVYRLKTRFNLKEKSVLIPAVWDTMACTPHPPRVKNGPHCGWGRGSTRPSWVGRRVGSAREPEPCTPTPASVLGPQTRTALVTMELQPSVPLKSPVTDVCVAGWQFCRINENAAPSLFKIWSWKRRAAAFKVNQDASLERHLGSFVLAGVEDQAGALGRTLPSQVQPASWQRLHPEGLQIFLNCKKPKSYISKSSFLLILFYCLFIASGKQ